MIEHMDGMAQHMDFPDLSDYISVSEASRLIGCSTKRVYQYVGEGRLSAHRIGRRMLILQRDEVQQFQPGPSGQRRAKAPPWRTYHSRGKLFITTIDVPIRPGKRDEVKERLAAVGVEQRHTFTRNVWRTVVARSESIRIEIVWKNTEIPDETTRQRDLRSFQQDFEDLLEWDAAISTFDEDVSLYT